MKFCDLNCDMGEGMGNDEAIMPFISSANIACGYHAADDQIMRETVLLCQKNNVKIGAHPSFDDKANFGRIEMRLPLNDIHQLIIKQISALKYTAFAYGASLHHVKAHGALYNMAARDQQLASAIANAVKESDPNLILYGLSGSYLISEGQKHGLRTASEVFADRTYQDDGSLTPRSFRNALIESEDESLKQVLQMVLEGKVTTVTGTSVPIVAETICIHGDGKNAVRFAEKIHLALQNNSIEIQSI
jgi:Uncharacterized proteins, homologs of lactam utilization protein B